MLHIVDVSFFPHQRLRLERNLKGVCHLAAQHCEQEGTLPEGRVTRTVHLKKRAIKASSANYPTFRTAETYEPACTW